MENRYYILAIVIGSKSPICFPKTLEEAMQIARPWVEQGYNVIITTGKYDEGGV